MPKPGSKVGDRCKLCRAPYRHYVEARLSERNPPSYATLCDEVKEKYPSAVPLSKQNITNHRPHMAALMAAIEPLPTHDLRDEAIAEMREEAKGMPPGLKALQYSAIEQLKGLADAKVTHDGFAKTIKAIADIRGMKAQQAAFLEALRYMKPPGQLPEPAPTTEITRLDEEPVEAELLPN